jgi:mRNA interferase HigB
VRILSKRTLREFWESSPKYADAEDSLKSWYREAKRASWLTPADVKEQYRNASILKNNRTVFNISGNKYRLVVEINYALQIIFIRFVGTHQDYDAVDVEKI